MSTSALRRRDFGALSNLADQPHWVYAIRHSLTDTCVYVGMTCDLRRRSTEHARQRGWREPDYTTTSIEVAGRAEAERVEADWIRVHRPTANRYPISLSSTHLQHLEDA